MQISSSNICLSPLRKRILYFNGFPYCFLFHTQCMKMCLLIWLLTYRYTSMQHSITINLVVTSTTLKHIILKTHIFVVCLWWVYGTAHNLFSIHIYLFVCSLRFVDDFLHSHILVQMFNQVHRSFRSLHLFNVDKQTHKINCLFEYLQFNGVFFILPLRLTTGAIQS